MNVALFSVVPPETKATTIATSNVILNLVIAVISFLIGVVSDATQLRWAFGGAVLLMFAALSTSPVSMVAPVVATYPLITVFLSAAVLREEAPALFADFEVYRAADGTEAGRVGFHKV